MPDHLITEGKQLAKFIVGELGRGTNDALGLWLAWTRYSGQRSDLTEIHDTLHELVASGLVEEDNEELKWSIV